MQKRAPKNQNGAPEDCHIKSRFNVADLVNGMWKVAPEKRKKFIGLVGGSHGQNTDKKQGGGGGGHHFQSEGADEQNNNNKHKKEREKVLLGVQKQKQKQIEFNPLFKTIWFCYNTHFP